MILYAESSAILTWLLQEPRAKEVAEILGEAEGVVASELTLVECDRALLRGAACGAMSEHELARRRTLLERASAHWHRLPMTGEVLERTRRPFPAEPIRTLDALHLASALAARGALQGVTLLSLDRRVRDAAAELAFPLLPA
jgi:hypothetical protein